MSSTAAHRLPNSNTESHGVTSAEATDGTPLTILPWSRRETTWRISSALVSSAMFSSGITASIMYYIFQH